MGTVRGVVLVVAALVLAVGCTGGGIDHDEALPDPCALIPQDDVEDLLGPALAVHGPDGVYDDGREAVCRWWAAPADTSTPIPIGRELVVSTARPDDPCARVRDRISGGAEAVSVPGGEGYLVAARDDAAGELGACRDGIAVTLRHLGGEAPILSLSQLLATATAGVPDAPVTTGVPPAPADRFAQAPPDLCAFVDRTLVAELTGITGPYESSSSPYGAGCSIGAPAGGVGGIYVTGGPDDAPTVSVYVSHREAVANRSGADVLAWQTRLQFGFDVFGRVVVDNLEVSVFAQPSSSVVQEDTSDSIARSVADRLARS